jgi:hypothetical protein
MGYSQEHHSICPSASVTEVTFFSLLMWAALGSSRSPRMLIATIIWGNQADAWFVTRYDVCRIACKVYRNTLTPTKVQSAFRKCGIAPFKPNVANDCQIAPSTTFKLLPITLKLGHQWRAWFYTIHESFTKKCKIVLFLTSLTGKDTSKLHLKDQRWHKWNIITLCSL